MELKTFQVCSPGDMIDIQYGEERSGKYVADIHAILTVKQSIPSESEHAGSVHTVYGTISSETEARQVSVTSYENYSNGMVIMRYL